MTTYLYRCASCGTEVDRDYPIGTAARTGRCPVSACGGTTRQVIGVGVNIAPSALENKGAQVRHINGKDRLLDADMTAYKRMRNRGLKPDRIDGSSQLEERVDDNVDITYKERLTKLAPKEPWSSTRERVLEGMALAKEVGL